METPRQSSSPRMPVVFVGHGSPMNAIEDNRYSQAWRAIGRSLPTPRAILCVSAHWYVPGTFLTGNANPETIHDFGGFPRELYEVQYPARGDGALADRVVSLLSRERAQKRDDWGLDHGTWSVLKHIRPEADVPVVQLSIDHRLPPADHVRIGRELTPLRDEGILILGSGNVTHNLRHAFSHRGGDTPEWASMFEANVTSALTQHDGETLARLTTTPEGRMAHPTPDHYYPLLYVAGATTDADTLGSPIEGFDYASLSMRSFVFSAS